MGNGALPNGPSYRAHPRLYLKGPSTYACQCLLIGHDQTCRGRALTAEFDPERKLAARAPPLAFRKRTSFRDPIVLPGSRYNVRVHADSGSFEKCHRDQGGEQSLWFWALSSSSFTRSYSSSAPCRPAGSSSASRH